MIATLEGLISEKTIGTIVLNVQGVGYGLFVTREDYDQLVVSELAKLYVYEHIREHNTISMVLEH